MIEILMATYNGEKYVREQIYSILAQTYTDWILKVCDDCSQDRTLEILQEFELMYPGKIIVYVSEKNSGDAKNNFLKLISGSSAAYVMTCDQDDVWKPNKIEVTMRHMLKVESELVSNMPVLVHTDLEVVDINKKTLSNSFFKMQKLNKKTSRLTQLLVQNNVTGCTMMINSQLASLIKEVPKYAIMHDWWCALIASAMGRVSFIDESTILYRQHGKNQVGAKNVQTARYILSKAFDVESIKKNLYITYIQASEFLKVYESLLTEEQKIVIRIYMSFSESNKIYKIYNTLIYGFWKYGLIRKMGQIIIL